MIFIDYDKEDSFDYHLLDVVFPDSPIVYDFEGLGLDPRLEYEF